jgi:hypothetical protein
MAVRGIFASHSGIVGDRQTDLAARVLLTMPGGMAPLLALSSGMQSAPAHDTAFSWIEDSWISGNTASAETVNAAATDFDVVDANIWTPNTIIMNEDSGEYMLITAISGVNVTVIRGIGGTTAAEVTSGDTLQSIGTGFAEGSGKPTPVAQRGETRTNYVQIFKNGWAITGTATAIDFTTGSQMAMNREQCLAYHAEDIERAFLWGKKDVRVIGNQQFRLSDGILTQIEQFGGLVESAAYLGQAGEMSLFGMQNFMRRIFDRRVKGMPNERIAFCGSLFLERIQQMAMMDATYNIEANESEFGIQITKLKFFNGQLNLITHPMMVENAIWNQELYVLHPGLIKRRVLRDSWSEEFSSKKQNNNGTDSTEGYIAIEQGFEVKGVETMGILRDVTTPVPSIQP